MRSVASTMCKKLGKTHLLCAGSHFLMLIDKGGTHVPVLNHMCLHMKAVWIIISEHFTEALTSPPSWLFALGVLQCI